GLTGDDIAQLVFRPAKYDIADDDAGVTLKSAGPGGTLVYYAELARHKDYTPLGGPNGNDIFYTAEAAEFCHKAPYESTWYKKSMFDEALLAGTATGGTTKEPGMKSLFIGQISRAIHTGGDTNPELFVSGGGSAYVNFTSSTGTESEVDKDGHVGASLPQLLVLVNGSRSAATAYSVRSDVPDVHSTTGHLGFDLSIGHSIAYATGWNVSDMYYVNNWPGTPLANHKPASNDTTNEFVTQVNYVSGYVCNASLQ
ncbi:hypothetical protein VAA18_005021, partial [Salmonella enterica]|nr:hypothetical protein [Salmonella enterica]